MEEAKEELEAALIQAKRECVNIQRHVLEKEKYGVRPGEDLYVRRFLYAIIVARRNPFYNGFRPSHVPRSKSLTRIYMEQRYHRSKSQPSSSKKRERSEPKLALVDNSDGITTKIEVTETVEESTLRDLIDNDQEECEHLQRHLPRTKGEWEHAQDVQLQISNGIKQKGAVFRMGDHLYGFDTIRDLSFQAADNVDRFFGRKPLGDSQYKSPYHFLHDYLQDYGRGFFKSSLSRSAYDLSEWSKRHLETPSVGSPLSLSGFDLNNIDNGTREFLQKVKQHNLALERDSSYREQIYDPYYTADLRPNSTVYERDDRNSTQWQNGFDRDTPIRPLSSASHLSSSIGASSMIQLPTYIANDPNSLSNNLLPTYLSMNSLDNHRPPSSITNYECNQHLVRNYHDPSDNRSTFMLLDADVKPLAPMLQVQDTIKSMTSSRHSTAEYLSIDRELELRSDLRTPISPYSDAHWSHRKTELDSRELAQKVTAQDIESHVGSGMVNTDEISEQRYDPYATKKVSGEAYINYPNTVPRSELGKHSEPEMSDSETLLPQPSPYSESDATLVQDESLHYDVDTLGLSTELEETHLNSHVSSIPSVAYTTKDLELQRKAEAELLLRDIQKTHRALQEEIDKYENAAWFRKTTGNDAARSTTAKEIATENTTYNIKELPNKDTAYNAISASTGTDVSGVTKQAPPLDADYSATAAAKSTYIGDGVSGVTKQAPPLDADYSATAAAKSTYIGNGVSVATKLAPPLDADYFAAGASTFDSTKTGVKAGCVASAKEELYRHGLVDKGITGETFSKETAYTKAPSKEPYKKPVIYDTVPSKETYSKDKAYDISNALYKESYPKGVVYDRVAAKGKYHGAVIYDDVADEKNFYDTVADDKNIYDDVYDSKDLHYAHGAIVMSEPVKRPLAVSPPTTYDQVAKESDVEELHYAETDLSKYKDDENVYEEIKEVEKPVPAERMKFASDINSNFAKEEKIKSFDDWERYSKTELPRDTVHGSLIHIGEGVKQQSVGRINRELDLRYQIIRDDEQKFSKQENRTAFESYRDARPIPSPTFQRLQNQYTPEDVKAIYNKGDDEAFWDSIKAMEKENEKNEKKSQEELQKEFDMQTALATVAIRKMSRSNQWIDKDDSEIHVRVKPRPRSTPRVPSPKGDFSSAQRSSSAAPSPSVNRSQEALSHRHTYNETSYGKRESRSQSRGPSHAAADFSELTYEGLYSKAGYEGLHAKIGNANLSRSTPTIGTYPSGGPKANWKSEEQLTRSKELDYIPLSKQSSLVGTYLVSSSPSVSSPVPRVAKPSLSTPRKGFVYDMARKFDANAFTRGTFVRTSNRTQKQVPASAAVTPSSTVGSRLTRYPPPLEADFSAAEAATSTNTGSGVSAATKHFPPPEDYSVNKAATLVNTASGVSGVTKNVPPLDADHSASGATFSAYTGSEACGLTKYASPIAEDYSATKAATSAYTGSGVSGLTKHAPLLDTNYSTSAGTTSTSTIGTGVSKYPPSLGGGALTTTKWKADTGAPSSHGIASTSVATGGPALQSVRHKLPPRRDTDSGSIRVHDAIYAIEHPNSPEPYVARKAVAVEESKDNDSNNNAGTRLLPIGTESADLNEVQIPRWSPDRKDDLWQSRKEGVHSDSRDHNASKDSAAKPSLPPRHSPQAAASAPKEAEQEEEKPVPLERNSRGRRTWPPVRTFEYKDFSRQKLKMPDIDALIHNGNLPSPEKFVGEENTVLRNWDPRALVRALYEVSYEPRVETKRNRFISMEGHVEVPCDETSTIAELERHWKQLYMRTKEGRLQVFVSHCADEAPAEEIVLSGVDVEANREERTFTLHGGREHIKLTLRVQSNVFDKWRHSLLSHAASSQIDAYVKPIPKTFQHLTERVVILELGSCSIRGGVLTTEPSLPQSFFPAMAVRTDDGRIIVGEDAYAPEIRHHGEFVRPIQAVDPAVERYSMDQDVVKACVQKVIKDLGINPSQYKILLSIPQNIPIALIGQLLNLVLKEARFQGAAITRQPSLILYAYDVTTGVVVDIGDRLNIVPVIDGYVVESAICSIPYGATQVREALRTILCSNNKGLYSFQSPIEKLILRYVLEQTSYVPEDYAREEKTAKEVNVSLDRFDPVPGMPTRFNIDNSRFLCTEGLFRPKKWGLDTKGLHQLVHEAVQMSPIDSRRTLYRNIYLAGGASLMPGLAEKLEQELAAIVPNSIHTQVHISPWRYNAAYLGAQIVASASTFSDSCVSLENLPTFLSHLQTSCF